MKQQPRMQQQQARGGVNGSSAMKTLGIFIGTGPIRKTALTCVLEGEQLELFFVSFLSPGEARAAAAAE